MIRFRDTVEKEDTPELLSSTGFQDIKPTGTMSCEKTVSFLEALFSVNWDSQNWHSIDEENLLTEIYG